MIALDTNVVVRLATRDDERQLQAARELVDREITFISLLCLLETAWVLSSIYRYAPSAIRHALLKLDAAGVVLELREHAIWALDRATAGADVGDMLLLIAARDTDAFATFDRRLARNADESAPVPVRLIA